MLTWSKVEISDYIADTLVMDSKAKNDNDVDAPPGVNIRRLREEQELSLRKLAKLCIPELVHTTIRRIENNDGWTRDTIIRLSKALGVNNHEDLFLPSELFNYSLLNIESKKRIAELVQESFDAELYRKNLDKISQ